MRDAKCDKYGDRSILSLLTLQFFQWCYRVRGVAVVQLVVCVCLHSSENVEHHQILDPTDFDAVCVSGHAGIRLCSVIQ